MEIEQTFAPAPRENRPKSGGFKKGPKDSAPKAGRGRGGNQQRGGKPNASRGRGKGPSVNVNDQNAFPSLA